MNRSIFFHTNIAVIILLSAWLIGFFLITGKEYAAVSLILSVILGAVSIISLLFWHSSKQLSASLVLIGIDCLILTFSIFVFGLTSTNTIVIFCIAGVAALIATTSLYLIEHHKVTALRQEILREVECARVSNDERIAEKVNEIRKVIAEHIPKINHLVTSAPDTADNFSPAAAINTIIDVCAYSIRTNNIEVHMNIPEMLRIAGPRDAFLQIMTEVLSQSIEMLVDTLDSKIITISTHTSLSYVWIHVSDTAQATQLFDDHSPLDQSRRLLEDEFRGEMLTEKTDGKGTIVSLKIPL